MHPLVRSAYMKKDSTSSREEDVLVLETSYKSEDMEFGGFDSYLCDLVSDLQDLKDQAEQQGGSVDRVDIRMH